jgi:hypothetical protein
MRVNAADALSWQIRGVISFGAVSNPNDIDYDSGGCKRIKLGA